MKKQKGSQTDPPSNPPDPYTPPEYIHENTHRTGATILILTFVLTLFAGITLGFYSAFSAPMAMIFEAFATIGFATSGVIIYRYRHLLPICHLVWLWICFGFVFVTFVVLLAVQIPYYTNLMKAYADCERVTAAVYCQGRFVEEVCGENGAVCVLENGSAGIVVCVLLLSLAVPIFIGYFVLFVTMKCYDRYQKVNMEDVSNEGSVGEGEDNVTRAYSNSVEG